MVYVRSIDAPPAPQCPDCTAIQHLCLSNGDRLTQEEAYFRVRAGSLIQSGYEGGPRLVDAVRGTTRYVRTAPNDTSNDNLLQLPRGC